MFVVHFFENRTPVLNQLLKSAPSEGENLTIKGRKGTVSSVNTIDEKNIHVQVVFEAVNKNKQPVDQAKKKKR